MSPREIPLTSTPAADPSKRSEVLAQVEAMLQGAADQAPVDSAQHFRRIGENAMRLDPRPGKTEIVYDLMDEVPLLPAHAIPLGLLAGEAIVNALKHAHPAGVPGEVRITTRRFAEDFCVIVEDDGVGLPQDFSPAADGQRGFQTMQTLADHLGARLTWRSTPLGLRLEILAPL